MNRVLYGPSGPSALIIRFHKEHSRLSRLTLGVNQARRFFRVEGPLKLARARPVRFAIPPAKSSSSRGFTPTRNRSRL